MRTTTLTDAEQLERIKQSQKKYNDKNQEKIKKYQKEYNKVYQKSYYDTHKEEKKNAALKRYYDKKNLNIVYKKDDGRIAEKFSNYFNEQDTTNKKEMSRKEDDE